MSGTSMTDFLKTVDADGENFSEINAKRNADWFKTVADKLAESGFTYPAEMVDCDEKSVKAPPLAGPVQGFLRRAFRTANAKFGPQQPSIPQSVAQSALDVSALNALLARAAPPPAPKPVIKVDIAQELATADLSDLGATAWYSSYYSACCFLLCFLYPLAGLRRA